MGGTTAGGLPWPAGTDLVRDGDNAIKALADKLESRGHGYRVEARTIAVTPNGAGGWSFSFARPFAAIPVAVNLTSTSSRDTSFMPVVEIMGGGISATGVSGRAVDITKTQNTSVTESFYVSYVAIGSDPTV